MVLCNHEFTPFREANEYLDDYHRLNSIYEEDGYLFFRSVLNSGDVLKVKCDLMRALQKQGIVEADAAETVWTGAGLEQVNEVELYALPSYAELLESPQLMRIAEKIFGEPVFMFKSYTIRYALPNDSAHVTPAHQDQFFIRINQRFRTLWIPLMDIDEQLGGLALGSGSHKRGLLDHVEQENVYSYVFRDRRQLGVSWQALPHPWLTTDYHPGDLLIFHNLMVHWSLPNRGDRVRLSLDNRFQPVTAPRTWQAERSIMDVRRIRETAKRIASEEGAGEALFEALLIELMHRGLEPERDSVKSLMAELAPEH